MRAERRAQRSATRFGPSAAALLQVTMILGAIEEVVGRVRHLSQRAHLRRIASIGRRVAAALLDLVLIGVIFFFLGRWFPLIAVLYFTAMWRWKGTTIGGILLRLKVVRTDGRPLNLAVALVRALSTCFSIVVLLLGFIWIAWDREKQAWHDKIAGTIVVRMPRDFSLL